MIHGPRCRVLKRTSAFSLYTTSLWKNFNFQNLASCFEVRFEEILFKRTRTCFLCGQLERAFKGACLAYAPLLLSTSGGL